MLSLTRRLTAEKSERDNFVSVGEQFTFLRCPFSATVSIYSPLTQPILKQLVPAPVGAAQRQARRIREMPASVKCVIYLPNLFVCFRPQSAQSKAFEFGSHSASPHTSRRASSGTHSIGRMAGCRAGAACGGSSRCVSPRSLRINRTLRTCSARSRSGSIYNNLIDFSRG